MNQKLPKRKQAGSLEQQLNVSFFFVSALVILLSLAITLYYDIRRQQKDMDDVISGTASYIASMPDVLSMLEAGYPNPNAVQDIDSLCSNIPNINVVVICDKNGLRFYHTDRQKTGESLVGGDEEQILAGSEPYITTGYGTKGRQRRAFHSIKDDYGTIVGFVMASVFTSHISDQYKNIILVHLAILVVMLFVSLFMSRLIVAFLRKSLMGLHPDELLDLYIKQDEMMNAVEEGLIASDPDGIVLFSNLVARRLYSDEDTPLMGRPLHELYPETKYASIIKDGTSEHGHSCIINGHTVLVNEIPIRSSNGLVQGVLTIISDKTELLAMSDELSGTRNMLDTLRSFNHEFLNKLHIILGYLQTGETKRAMNFIINSNLVSSQAIRQTADCLRVSRICALVIGKMMHAAELGISLSLTHDSICMDKDLLLPAEAYITIIGNLLENAIEELDSDGPDIEEAGVQETGSETACEEPLKEIKLGIYFRPDLSLITCEDTGGGIPQALLSRIYEKGISSKGDTRGTGLYLIRQIVEEYHGEIVIDTEEGEGTCFTITFTRKELSPCIKLSS